MAKTENRDYAFIFSEKRLFNSLSEINLSDMVIVTVNFNLHLARPMFDSKLLCHMKSLRPFFDLKFFLNFFIFHPIWMKFGMGADNGAEII